MKAIHASDLRNFERCPRRAAYARVQGRTPPPEGSSAALGTEVHACLERFIDTGEPPDDGTPAGRIAWELIPRVPPPPRFSEVPFSFRWRGLLLEGSIDVVAPGRLLDWKTTGDLRYALATLSGAVQPAVYSEAYRHETGEVPFCEWIYVSTRTRAVRVLAGRASALERWEDDMHAMLRYDEDPDSAPQNTRACGDYGGCPYVARCGTELTAMEIKRGA